LRAILQPGGLSHKSPSEDQGATNPISRPMSRPGSLPGPYTAQKSRRLNAHNARRWEPLASSASVWRV